MPKEQQHWQVAELYLQFEAADKIATAICDFLSQNCEVLSLFSECTKKNAVNCAINWQFAFRNVHMKDAVTVIMCSK